MKYKIKELRNKTGLSQDKFAILLGVSVSSLRRWETGDSSPSPIAQKRIIEILQLSDEALMRQCRHLKMYHEQISNDLYNTSFIWNHQKYRAVWTPYVINGPKDQFNFYKTLIEMQQKTNIPLSPDKYFSRLSLLRAVNDVETSQFQMEKPRWNAKSWSSDYGTHGFHRYVGRFPAHLIRALINAFGATKDDVILDSFCGSGTTLVEARMLGVKAKGIEISPLSAMMSRVKSQFSSNGFPVASLLSELTDFYSDKWETFVSHKSFENISFQEIISRPGNTIKPFSNIERWFTKEALLGTSIAIEFILQKNGYTRDFLTIALSAKMRSIGNVDVDVVRAEYRKTPRKNVDVLKLLQRQIQKMASGISETITTCKNTLGSENDIEVFEQSVLSTSIAANSVSHIITSPPYGIESLSYLRTHLLSFRVLESILGIDPYNFGDGIIGSEYLDDTILDTRTFRVNLASKTYVSYFKDIASKTKETPTTKRILMMMKFFEDMYSVIERFSIWIKKNGNVAFIIGNKKIGNSMIPTDEIIKEIFLYFGFEMRQSIQHKLKTNNSNSQVPWQDRIIENEYILLFQKVKD